MKKVSDPTLLQQLNGAPDYGDPQQRAQALIDVFEPGSPRKVSDPAILAQLNGQPSEPSPSEAPPAESPLQSPDPAPQLNRAENYRNAVIGQLGKVGTGIAGLGVDAAQAAGLLDPDVAKEAKNIVSEGRQKVAQQNPTQPGVERWIGENVIGNPTNFMPGGPVVSGALAGAAGSALEADPAAPLASKATSAGIGGTVGGGTGFILGKLFNPSKSSLTPEQQRLATVAQQEGINLTPAQQTGNKTLGAMEAAFANLPFTANKQEAIRGNQFTQFTKAALKKAGVDADAATPEVLRQAYDDIGGTIGKITRGQDVPVDNQMIADVLKTMDEYGNVIDPLRKPQFDSLVDAITSKSMLPGESYQRTRSQLGKIMKSAWKSDPNYANAIEGLQDALDSAAMRVMPSDQAVALQTARQQYGNLKTIMKAMEGASQDAAAGMIPPATFRGAVKNANNVGYTTGKGDLNDLARVGTTFLKGSIPDSGTATRTNMQRVLQGNLLPAVFGGAAGNVPGAAAALALPPVIQALYNRPLVQKYAVNGIPTITPELQTLAAALAGRGAASVTNKQ